MRINNWFRRLSLTRKLTAIGVAAATASVVMAGAALLAFDLTAEYHAEIRDIAVVANMAVKDAVTTRNPEALRAAAHALKGAAGNLSATRLFAAADVLERIGAAARMDAAEGAWRQLSVESSQLMDVLRGKTLPPANEALSCVS